LRHFFEQYFAIFLSKYQVAVSKDLFQLAKYSNLPHLYMQKSFTENFMSVILFIFYLDAVWNPLVA